MRHNYKWLTEEVRSSVCQSPSSEAVSAHPLILPWQAHASWSASHETASVWKPHADVGTEWCLCWVRQEVHLWTISRSHLHLLQMREPNLQSLRNTGQPQIHTEAQQRSQLAPSLLPQRCLTSNSLSVFRAFSKHFYGTDFFFSSSDQSFIHARAFPLMLRLLRKPLGNPSFCSPRYAYKPPWPSASRYHYHFQINDS